MHLKELLDPFSSFIQHVCFNGGFLSSFDFVFDFVFILFKGLGFAFLEYLKFLSLFFDRLKQTFGDGLFLNS